MKPDYTDVAELLGQEDPKYPVYCIYPAVYEDSTRRFVEGFPGRTLYAVKANNYPGVLRALYEGGVRHFDCASLAEIELVNDVVGADGQCYFMNPVRLPGDARAAQDRFGVSRFVVDESSGLDALCREIDAEKSTVFVRMATSHASAVMDLSSKFGAHPDEIPGLLTAVRERGAQPALAFNVGSFVRSPEAYSTALGRVSELLSALAFRLRLVDIGGGFPLSYPGYEVPPLDDFFAVIRGARAELPLAGDGELMAEPGRALSAPGMSAVSRVLLRKPDRLYLNDGMYGGFWELRCKAQERYACRAFRKGEPLVGSERPFRLFGPTCDSSDVLPASVMLPDDIQAGDHIEFGAVGAYSLSGRTDFNGFGQYSVVSFSDPAAVPP